MRLSAGLHSQFFPLKKRTVSGGGVNVTARFTIEVHQPLFFLILPPNLGDQDLSQELISRKTRTATGKNKCHGLGAQESRPKKWPIIYFFSDDFGLRSPVIQKPFQAKSATSTVARV